MRRYLVLAIIIMSIALTGCGAAATTVSNTPAVESSPAAQTETSSRPAAALSAQTTAPATQLAVTPAPAAPAITPAPSTSATAAIAPTDPQPADAAGTIDVDWARTQVTTTLYSVPDTGTAMLGTLASGSLVVVTQVDGDWVRIIHLGDSPYAWVPAGALTFDVSATAATTPASHGASPASASSAATPVSPAPVTATRPTASSEVSVPAASAAGKSGLSGTLVFQTSNGGTIYLYDLAGQKLRALTTGFDPALSPDGKTVAFTRVGGEQGVYLIGSDGSNERLIYSGSESLRAPHWSPDGRYIVFSRVTGHWYCRQMGPQCVPDRPGLENLPLVMMDDYGLSRIDVDGNEFRDIVALETAAAPDWNAAGIVYQSAPGIQVTADQPDATHQLLAGSWDSHYQDPDWQPNGGRIVFQARQGSHWEIYAVNADGTGLTALTKPGNALVNVFPHNVSPAWSPDGQSIVFLSNRTTDDSAGDWHLWVMNADGSNQRLLDPDVLGQLVFRYDFALDQVVDWQ